MACSVIFLLDRKGKVVLYRDYRGNVEPNCIKHFRYKLLTTGLDAPIFSEKDVHFVYRRHADIYLVAMSKGKNINVCLIIEYLQRFIKLYLDYFSELNVKTLHDNITIVYGLLDETMDFGYPQSLESGILKQYVYRREVDGAAKVPMAVTNAVSWRSEGLFYERNEIILDVCERISVMVNPGGEVIRNEVMGVVKVQSKLSDMPIINLRIDNILKVSSRALEDVNYHHCVRLTKTNDQSNIRFIPPDGLFDLFTYRLPVEIPPPFWVQSELHKASDTRFKCNVTLRTDYGTSVIATVVMVYIPVPKDVDSYKFFTSSGHVQYVPERQCFLWSLMSVPSGASLEMQAMFTVSSIHSKIEFNAPISLNFHIPAYSYSNLKICDLSIFNCGYVAWRKINYCTDSGDYSFRMG